jgi:hypothetical protein
MAPEEGGRGAGAGDEETDEERRRRRKQRKAGGGNCSLKTNTQLDVAIPHLRASLGMSSPPAGTR